VIISKPTGIMFKVRKMKRYWVIGGEYASTAFKDMADGKAPHRFGPFDTAEEAQTRWSTLSWANVDNCHARYEIVAEDAPASGRAA
jgi:Domain of unknown function (DUF4170)